MKNQPMFAYAVTEAPNGASKPARRVPIEDLRAETSEEGAPTSTWLEKNSYGTSKGYVVLVTPELAGKWLRANSGNRKLKPGHVASMRSDIVAGRWKLTHQGIAFSANGRLLDGQHRLQAIVKANIAAPMLVFSGEEDDLFGVYDRGMKRTMRDHVAYDSRLVDAATYAVRTCITEDGRAPSPEEVRDLCERLAPDFEALLGAAASNAKGRVSGSGRSAWLLRHHFANTNDREMLCQQWRAFVEFRLDIMDATTAAAVRRFETFRGRGGGVMQNERFCITWVMFNLKNRNLSKIYIRDVPGILAEMREATKAVLAEKKDA